MIKEISRRHGIRGFDSQLDDSQIREFIDKVSKMSRDQSLTLERIKVHYAPRGNFASQPSAPDTAIIHVVLLLTDIA